MARRRTRRGARRDLGKERLWRRLVRLWRRSGRTVREFCAEHQVSEPSFYAWRRTLAERDRQRGGRGQRNTRTGGDGASPRQHRNDTSPTQMRSRSGGASALQPAHARPTFVPVRVVATAAQHLACADGTGMAFEVVLHGGRVVRVPAGFDAASLRQLLAVLEERPC